MEFAGIDGISQWRLEDEALSDRNLSDLLLILANLESRIAKLEEITSNELDG